MPKTLFNPDEKQVIDSVGKIEQHPVTVRIEVEPELSRGNYELERYSIKEPLPLMRFRQPVPTPLWPQKTTLLPTPSHILTKSEFVEKYSQPQPAPQKPQVNILQEPEIVYVVKKTSKSTVQSINENYKLSGPDDKTLLFESRFEGGNLQKAVKM